MPLLSRPVNWNNEIGTIDNVSDPRHRHFSENHPPSNPYLYRRAYQVAFEIFNRLDNPGLYSIYLTSEQSLNQVPPTKKHITRINLNINPFDVHPKLVVEELETEDVPIRFDYIEDHLGLQYYKLNSNQTTRLQNKYDHMMQRWGELWAIYDLFVALLIGSSTIQSGSLIMAILQNVITKYKITLSDLQLANILRVGFKYWAFN